MRTANLVLCVMLGTLVALCEARADEEPEAHGVLGYWLCDSGDCPDEAIELADNDGVRTYNSWLHDRPSAVDGRWTLNGARLVITCCEDIEYDYQLVEVGEERLVLRDADEPGENIVLHRPPSAGRRDEVAPGTAPAASP